MADLDYGRKMDLEELTKAMANAQTISEKEYYEKIAHSIVNESTEIRSLREELIGAMRAKDFSRVKRIREHIQYVKLNETRGTSWGNLRGNKQTF